MRQMSWEEKSFRWSGGGMRNDNESQCSYNMLFMSEHSKKNTITKDYVGCPENDYCLHHRYHER